MKYTRLYSDATGESHFENLEAEFQTVYFAPPALPLDVSVFEPAEQCAILMAKPSWTGDWHPVPYRQVHFYLSGKVEAETSDGEVRIIGAGEIAPVEDTNGKGHKSRVLGSKAAIITVVKLSE